MTLANLYIYLSTGLTFLLYYHIVFIFSIVLIFILFLVPNLKKISKKNIFVFFIPWICLIFYFWAYSLSFLTAVFLYNFNLIENFFFFLSF